ncbi:VOC family protein [Roseomonas sp. OT10]|uniref:VOC family protein n=1 Tax=Roseomonas cutis TaxID=2897332 RepID=UPI001E45E4A4|nr:VOC family protein [Roseomonas sp. OT10]UFN47475.1 VOC family protein [Roseomonas sp. OT10]
MTEGVATGLDHVGVCTRDGPALWARWEALGFALTPLARHSAPAVPGGPAVPMATGNRCAMLRQGYLELLAILDPSLPDNGMGQRLDRYEGMHILALAIADAGANLARLRAAGLDIPGVSHLERPVDAPDGPRAAFSRLPLPDAPEGRIQLIQHLTPELLWQPRWLEHPNNAVALETVVLASEAPAESAARLSRLAGLPLEPDPAGGYALPLRHGRVRILPPASLEAVLPGVVPPSLPFLAGIVVRTGDGNAAARRLLAGVAADGPLGLTVPPDRAGGVALAFAA